MPFAREGNNSALPAALKRAREGGHSSGKAHGDVWIDGKGYGGWDGMEEAAQHNQSSCFVPRDDSVVFWASKREHTYGLSVSDTE